MFKGCCIALVTYMQALLFTNPPSKVNSQLRDQDLSHAQLVPFSEFQQLATNGNFRKETTPFHNHA